MRAGKTRRGLEKFERQRRVVRAIAVFGSSVTATDPLAFTNDHRRALPRRDQQCKRQAYEGEYFGRDALQIDFWELRPC